MIITTEMLFDKNVKQIITKIENDWCFQIQKDFDTEPNKYPDLLTWLELHPDIVGKAFIKHIIDFGYTNENIN